MVVMTAKLSKKKLLIAAAAVVLAVVLVFCLKNARPAPDDDPANSHAAFLSSFGYSVEDAPVQVGQVQIPTEPSEVFDRYNALQKSQGYDLSALAGRSVTRYVYKLSGAGEGEWYATVLEYRGEIVGGDVADSAPGGRMHGFTQSA